MSIEEAVWRCLEGAVERFNRSNDPATLLCPRNAEPRTRAESVAASERAIAYRLAFYLESELRRVGIVEDGGRIAVDCEYNRHIGATKSLAADAADEIARIVRKARKRELEADDDGFYVFSVAPDIVVHQRFSDADNLLVVELKKRSNPETEDYDRLKLALFTEEPTDHRGYGYSLGAWLVAEDECAPEQRALKIIAQYRNGTAMVLAE